MRGGERIATPIPYLCSVEREQKTQLLAAEDLGLKPRRPASYGHKIQVLSAEDPRLQ